MYYEIANQFVKCGVLKCNHLFKWIETNGVYRHKRKMWGIDSTQNSYTSGVWRDYKTATYDDQDKFYLPLNDITLGLRHDIRICLSMLQKEPWTYKITKVNNTTPKGIVTFTVKQDKFEPEHDYVQMDPNADDYGDMYPDYYDSDVKSCINDNFDCKSLNYNKYTIVIESVNNKVKLGMSKVLTAKIYDADNNDVSDMFKNSQCVWDFKLDDITLNRKELFIIDNNYSLKKENKFKCKFMFDGDEKYLEHNITVMCQIEDMLANIQLDIVAL